MKKNNLLTVLCFGALISLSQSYAGGISELSVSEPGAKLAEPLLGHKSKNVRVALGGLLYPWATTDLSKCPSDAVSYDGVCGFEVEVFAAVCEKTGMKCNWVNENAEVIRTAQEPGKNLLDGVNWLLSGLESPLSRYDVVVSFLRGSSDRLEKYNSSPAYAQVNTGFFKSPKVDSKSLVLHKSSDLNKNLVPMSFSNGDAVKIAVLGKYKGSVTDLYKGIEGAKIEVIEASSNEEIITSLLDGSVDFTFNNVSSNSVFGPLGISLSKVVKPGKTQDWGPRAYTTDDMTGVKLSALIKIGLAEIKENGTYDRIARKFNLTKAWSCYNGPKIKSIDVKKECF